MKIMTCLLRKMSAATYIDPTYILRLNFFEPLWVDSKTERKIHRDFPYTILPFQLPPPPPSLCIAFPTMKNLHLGVAFLTIKEPTLTPKIHSLHKDFLLVLYIQWVLTNVS